MYNTCYLVTIAELGGLTVASVAVTDLALLGMTDKSLIDQRKL